MQNQNGNTPRYPRRNAAEDRVWRRLYRSAGNPVAASEMLQHLESDDEALRFHLALVLRCRETLRRQAARRARIERVIRAIGLLWRVAVRSMKALQNVFAARQVARHGTSMPASIRRSFAVIEDVAPRANAVQLRAYIARAKADRALLEGEDRAYADSLLLKLDRLLRDQLVEPALVEPALADPASAPRLASVRLPVTPYDDRPGRTFGRDAA